MFSFRSEQMDLELSSDEPSIFSYDRAAEPCLSLDFFIEGASDNSDTILLG